MPRSYRCIVLALVGWLACTGADQPRKDAKRASTDKQTSQPVTAEPAFTAYPNYNAERCYKAKDHDSADLCAQWRAAVAAEKSARDGHASYLIDLFAAVLTLVGTGLIFAAWKAAQATNRIGMAALKEARLSNQRAYSVARTASDAQLRPYIGFDPATPVEPWTREADIQVNIKNYGQTPASEIRWSLGTIVVPRPIGYPHIDWDEEIALSDLQPQEVSTMVLDLYNLEDDEWDRIQNGEVLVLALRFTFTGLNFKQPETQVVEYACFLKRPGVATIMVLNKHEREGDPSDA